MSYDLKLLTKSTGLAPLSGLEAVSDDVRFEILDGSRADWSQLLVTNARGDEICILERASLRTTSREVEWLLDDLVDRQPQSAAMWAAAYLRATRAVYGCNLLSFGFAPAYVGVPSMLLWAIQELVGDGILHVEGQGYSNEDGYQITWEFSDKVKGSRQVAVLDAGGHWHPFEIDLGEGDQRDAFRSGRNPFGTELLVLH